MPKMKYYIEHPGEMGAGLHPYTESVTVDVGHDAGGEDGEFEEHMRACLAEWFDGAAVTLVDQSSEDVE